MLHLLLCTVKPSARPTPNVPQVPPKCHSGAQKRQCEPRPSSGSGNVPVAGTLPELGLFTYPRSSAGEWHFGGTWGRFGVGCAELAPVRVREQRPQQRSERGPGEARAQLCELHGRSRPPDCCPGWPWPTQIAQRSRCPSPQPKATSQGSTPPSLDETALGRSGRSGALYTACD